MFARNQTNKTGELSPHLSLFTIKLKFDYADIEFNKHRWISDFSFKLILLLY